MVGQMIDAIKPYINDFTTWLMQFMESIDIGAILDSIIKIMNDTLTKIWDAIAPALGTMWDKFAPWLEKNFPDVKNLLDNIWKFALSAQNVFGEGPSGLVEAVKSRLIYTGMQISDAIFGAVNMVISAVTSMAVLIRSLVTKAVDVIFDVNDIFIKIYAQAKGFFADLTAIMGVFGFFVKDATGFMAGKYKTETDALWATASSTKSSAESEKLTSLFASAQNRDDTQKKVAEGFGTLYQSIDKLNETLTTWQQTINLNLVIKDQYGNVLTREQLNAYYSGSQLSGNIQG